MRSPFVIAANLTALRFELGDLQYSYSRVGLNNDEMARISCAVQKLKEAEESLKAFRFIKKVEDLPESAPAPKPKKSGK